MRHFYCFVFVFFFLLNAAFAINEIEPNNDFGSANNMSQDSVFVGKTCFNEVDYAVSRQKIAGTVEIIFTRTNKSTNNSYIYFRVYDKNTSTIVTKLFYSNINQQVSDTFRINCMNDDSVYFQLIAGECYDYSFKYSVITPNYANDKEDNNVFSKAQTIDYNTLTTGQVGFRKPSQPDPNDYFKGNLPNDGTLRVIVETFNQGDNNSYMYFNSAYKNTNQIKSNLYYSNASEYRKDTILVPCLAKDSIYFYITSGTCFSYQFTFEVIAPLYSVENENNNDKSGAVELSNNTYQEGRINFSSSSFYDNIDYFKTKSPENGTLRIVLEKANNDIAGNSYMYFNTYNKYGNTLNSSLYYQNANETKLDTILISCVGSDSVYFNVSSGRCYSYKFKYDVIPAKYSVDLEDNNSLSNAIPIDYNSIKEGNIYYSKADFNDNVDYYKAILPQNGRLRVILDQSNQHLTNNGYMYFNSYNKSGGLIQSNLYYSNAATNRLDTIYAPCLGADTIYFYVSTGSCFSYKFKFETLSNTFSNDYENNSDFANATAIAQLINVNGDASFFNYNKITTHDYYKTLLSVDGTLKIKLKKVNHSYNNSYMYFNTYNKNTNLINSKLFYSDPNALTNDSFYIHCLARDSVYFTISTGACYSYQFNYEIENPLFSKDLEPNNTNITSLDLNLAQKIEGQIGYSSTLGTDEKDVYRMLLPSDGQVTIDLKLKNHFVNQNYLLVTAYNQKNQSVFSKYVYVNPSDTLFEQLNIGCQTTDTLYLHLFANNCFSYQLSYNFTNQTPAPKIEAHRVGNNVGFVAANIENSKFNWNFDNGKTSTARFPIQNFAYGDYNVQLIATNLVCNYKVIDTLRIEVKGVEYFTPNNAGVGGDFAMQIFGGGLDTNTQIILRKGNIQIAPLSKYGNSKNNQLTAVFDFHFAEEGDYDVEIKIKGDSTYTFLKGMNLGKFKYPYCVAEITGPTRMRRGVNTNFFLSVGNTGNVTASGVLVGLAWPKTASLTIGAKEIKPPKDSVLTVTAAGLTVSLNTNELYHIYDSLNAISPISSFEGKPFDGFYTVLQIPHVPAGATVDIPLIIKAAGLGEQRIISFVYSPNLFGSPLTPNHALMTDNLASEMINYVDEAADNTKNVPLQVLVKSVKIGQQHLALDARMAGDHFWAWWDGYEIDGEIYQMRDKELTAANEYALKTTTEEAAKFFIKKGVKDLNKLHQERVDHLNSILADKGVSPEGFERVLEGLNKYSGDNDRLNRLFELFEKVDKLKSMNDKREELLKMVEDCPELKKQLDDLLNQLNKENEKKDIKEKKPNSLVSFDPNAIYGPEGIESNRYITNKQLQSYYITFENVDTAKADAREVIVRDTLDPKIYDLSTFSFGNVSVGRFSSRIPKNRTQFVTDIPIYPIRDLTVRVFASLDTISGEIVWRFVGIDTLTGDFPVDALVGFLPPNKIAPEGEGSMMYSVMLKSTLPSGTTAKNTAHIYFDDNEPISTNTWQNIVDIAAPTSKANAQLNDLLISVTFDGLDAESGIGAYIVYASENNGEWYPVKFTRKDTAFLEGEYGKSYAFYALAEDKLGNKENKMPIAESSVTMPSAPSDKDAQFVIIPNPNNGNFEIKNIADVTLSEFKIYNIKGALMYELNVDVAPGQKIPVRLTGEKNGFYLIRGKQTDGKTTSEKLIIGK